MRVAAPDFAERHEEVRDRQVELHDQAMRAFDIPHKLRAIAEHVGVNHELFRRLLGTGRNHADVVERGLVVALELRQERRDGGRGGVPDPTVAVEGGDRDGAPLLRQRVTGGADHAPDVAGEDVTLQGDRRVLGGRGDEGHVHLAVLDLRVQGVEVFLHEARHDVGIAFQQAFGQDGHEVTGAGLAKADVEPWTGARRARPARGATAPGCASRGGTGAALRGGLHAPAFAHEENRAEFFSRRLMLLLRPGCEIDWLAAAAWTVPISISATKCPS